MHPGIRRIFLAAQVVAPGSDAPGTGHPDAAPVRKIDAAGGHRGHHAGGRILAQLGQIHPAGPGFEMGDVVDFVASRQQRGKIVVG